MTTFPLIGIGAWVLIRTLHVKNKSLPFVFLQQLSQDLLSEAFTSQFFTNCKVPVPVERGSGIDDGDANKVITAVKANDI